MSNDFLVCFVRKFVGFFGVFEVTITFGARLFYAPDGFSGWGPVEVGEVGRKVGVWVVGLTLVFRVRSLPCVLLVFVGAKFGGLRRFYVGWGVPVWARLSPANFCFRDGGVVEGEIPARAFSKPVDSAVTRGSFFGRGYCLE